LVKTEKFWSSFFKSSRVWAAPTDRAFSFCELFLCACYLQRKSGRRARKDDILSTFFVKKVLKDPQKTLLKGVIYSRSLFVYGELIMGMTQKTKCVYSLRIESCTELRVSPLSVPASLRELCIAATFSPGEGFCKSLLHKKRMKSVVYFRFRK
jgi:hypothetical protein